VPVIPADSIPREGIVPHNRFHHTAAGGATGRLRLDKDVISRRKSRDCPSVDSAPEGTLATPHRRAAVPHHNGASNADRHAAPLVACPAVVPTAVVVPSASADGRCHDGAELYDTGVPGGFKQDRNLNGLVCFKYRLGPKGYHDTYTDDF
jgi:hypothetical protein